MSDEAKQNLKGWAATLIVALIGAAGGWFGSVLTYKSNLAATGSSLEEKYLGAFTTEIDKLRATVTLRDETISTLQSEIRNLTVEVESLREAVEQAETTSIHPDAEELLEMVMNAMPYPAWLHEVGKSNWFLNDAYADVFKVNRANFWTPINILRRYPSEMSARYVANDMHVVELRKGHLFREMVNSYVLYPESPSNPSSEWEVLKIPMLVSGNQYVFGAWVTDGTPDSIFFHYREKRTEE